MNTFEVPVKNYSSRLNSEDMWTQLYQPQTTDESTLCELYYRLLQAWNEKDAKSFAWLLSGKVIVIGFDGSIMNGQEQVEQELKAIFRNHQTGTYVSKVRNINHIDDHSLLLTALAGMIPPKGTMINPALNAVQTLLSVKKDSIWQIELFQNTPLQLHNNPELLATFTYELNSLARPVAAG